MRAGPRVSRGAAPAPTAGQRAPDAAGAIAWSLPGSLRREGGARDVELRMAREAQPTHRAGDATLFLGVVRLGADRDTDGTPILDGGADVDGHAVRHAAV